jgi:hypothetical protein
MKGKTMKKTILFLFPTLLLLLGCGAERFSGEPDGQGDGEEMDGIEGMDLNDLFDLPDLGEGCFPEVCNGLDDDCDGEVDEDFDLMSDVMNCGACNLRNRRLPRRLLRHQRQPLRRVRVRLQPGGGGRVGR